MDIQDVVTRAGDAEDISAPVAADAAWSVFDLDRTLTRRPTYSLFLLSAAWRRAPWRLALIPLLLPWAVGYALKAVPRRQMKQMMHRLMLGRTMPRVALEAVADAFARRVVERGLYGEALAVIRAERAGGRTIVLATAAPDYYARAIAREIGIRDVIATRSRWRRDKLGHVVDGENCRGPIKHYRLVEHLRAAGIDRRRAHIRFFSDDLSDLPCFEYADEAIAVNPSVKLRRVAEARGWPIHDWRRP